MLSCAVNDGNDDGDGGGGGGEVEDNEEGEAEQEEEEKKEEGNGETTRCVKEGRCIGYASTSSILLPARFHPPSPSRRRLTINRRLLG